MDIPLLYVPLTDKAVEDAYAFYSMWYEAPGAVKVSQALQSQSLVLCGVVSCTSCGFLVFPSQTSPSCLLDGFHAVWLLRAARAYLRPTPPVWLSSWRKGKQGGNPADARLAKCPGIFP